MKMLDGKVAIVTGGSSGLGAATVLEFARQGARVVVAARRKDRSEEVVAQIAALGGEGLFVQTDVTKPTEVEAMVAATLAKFGRLDCAFNNAGITGPTRRPVAEIKEDAWDAVMNSNLKSVWLSMKYEIPAMLEHGKGAIVNNASIYGLIPSDFGHASYCASKFGVVGLTKSAAVDYGLKGIRVNAICPGYAHSEMVDPYVDKLAPIIERHSAMNRLGEAQEIADTVAWLCSDRAGFVNGTALPLNGGDTTKLY
ncbi:MAG: glucose 1-dehydrogenase [Alphaproteobacteria bacterium]|nr:glucose 1-dehydrogenase [Alphaproteobacteria bacterium]